MLKSPVSGVICAGNICLDILVKPVDVVSWESTAWVDSIEQHMGGNGANTSYTLAQLGVPVRLLGIVGQDDFGEKLLGLLKGAGVATDAIDRSKAPTSATVCLVNSSGSRLFLHRLGSSAEAFALPIDFTRMPLDGFSHYHLANPFSLPRLMLDAADSLRCAREMGLTTSLDTGWDASGRWLESLGACLPHVDLLFVNRDEAKMLTGIAEPEGAAHKFRELGVGDVVVKMGAAGCAVFSCDDAFYTPGFEVDVIDTTGAGDCFVAGFLAALHRGVSYREAARFANAVGALSVQQLGANTGVKSYAETQIWIQGERAVESKEP